jgi:hypothetical protein
MPDSELVAELRTHLNRLIEFRVNHVRSWLDCNLARFQGEHAAIEDLRRRFDNMVIEMKTNVQLCGAQCASCYLICIRSRLHEGDHSCNTDHKCGYNCGFCEDEFKLCSTRYVIFSLFSTPIEESVGLGILGSICKRRVHLDSAAFSSSRRCVVTAHLCGEPCKLSGRRGCLEDCTKVSCCDRFLERHALKVPQVMGHDDDDHMCSALVHTCGEVWTNLR